MTRTTRNTTRNDDDSGIISKAINTVKQAFGGGKVRSGLRVAGILSVALMVVLSGGGGLLAALGGYSPVGQVAAQSSGNYEVIDGYSTTTGFQSVQDFKTSTVDETNDTLTYNPTTDQSASYNAAFSSPVDGVRVDVTQVGSLTLQISDSSGQVVDEQTITSAGTYTLEGAAGDVTKLSTQASSGSGTAEVDYFETLNEVPTGAVDVTVEDQNGNAVENADVELYDLAQGQVVDTLTTDANGFVSFSGVEQGKDYDVDVSPPSGYDSALTTITHNSNPTTVTVTTSQTMGDIEGQVTDDTGTAVGNYTVNLLDSSGTQVETATTDSNGQYVFANHIEGDYTVEFADGSTYESQTKTVTVVGGENHIVDASLVPVTADTGSLQVEVTDNGAVEGASVSVLDSTDSEVTTGTTDADGVFTASELEVGDYTVEVTHDETTHTQTLTVETGVTATGTYELGTSSGDGWFTPPNVSDDNKQMVGFLAAILVILGTAAAIAKD